jgi:hypothetical protein
VFPYFSNLAEEDLDDLEAKLLIEHEQQINELNDGLNQNKLKKDQVLISSTFYARFLVKKFFAQYSFSLTKV